MISLGIKNYSKRRAENVQRPNRSWNSRNERCINVYKCNFDLFFYFSVFYTYYNKNFIFDIEMMVDFCEKFPSISPVLDVILYNFFIF